jgi:hypothetical protein
MALFRNRIESGRRWIGAMLALSAVACGDSNPTGPSSSRFQVTFTSAAPERCSGPCLRLAWVDQGSVGQDLLKIAVQVQNIPARGIPSVSNILSGKVSGTFSEPTPSVSFSAWHAGDFFERLGKPVRYEASDFPSTSTCCLTTYSAGFPTPTPTDRVSGDGTVIVLVYRLRQPGSLELEPGVGLLDDIFVTTYAAQVRVTES